ncbi:hypothetical protein B0H15DRAFT_955849 [Mycena belliarum]|uniref:Uncharacterized protein n=1 Tax=Mycena belliarum TaxID=1033014 RepID=A0AAD6TVQ0_9AGAR|nr:hypothetical protein B0H15DRAFT_955849 [Mycena belliae]
MPRKHLCLRLRASTCLRGSSKGCRLRLRTHQVVHASLPRTPRSTPPLPPSDRAAPAPLDYATYSYSHEAVLVHRRKRRVLSYGASSGSKSRLRRRPQPSRLRQSRLPPAAPGLTPHVRSGTPALTHSHEARFPHVVPRVRSTQVPVTNPLDPGPRPCAIHSACLRLRPRHPNRVRRPLRPPATAHSPTRPVAPLTLTLERARRAFPSHRTPPAAIRGSRAGSCRRVRPRAGAPCTTSAAFPFHPAPALRACPRLRPALNSRLPHRAPRSSRLPLPPIPRPSVPSHPAVQAHLASHRCALRLAHPIPIPARLLDALRPKSALLSGTRLGTRAPQTFAPRTFARAPPSPPSSSLPIPAPSQIPIPPRYRSRARTSGSSLEAESRVPSPESRVPPLVGAVPHTRLRLRIRIGIESTRFDSNRIDATARRDSTRRESNRCDGGPSPEARVRCLASRLELGRGTRAVAMRSS